MEETDEPPDVFPYRQSDLDWMWRRTVELGRAVDALTKRVSELERQGGSRQNVSPSRPGTTPRRGERG